MRRGLLPLQGVAAGLLLAASVPPMGFWPLGIAGAAVLAWRLGERSWRARLILGVVAGLAFYGITLWWVHEFTLPGWMVFATVEALVLGGTTVAAGAGRPLVVSFPAAMVLGEALRSEWPFGGLPLGGIDLGQVGGPLAATASVGGRLLVVGLVALAGAGLAHLAARVVDDRIGSPRHAVPVGGVVALVVVVAAAIAAHLAPDGRRTGTLRAALVQGGGPRGLRATERENSDFAFQAQVRASERLPAGAPVDLVLWPEDVIDVGPPVGTTAEGATVAELADRVGAPVVAGVLEDADPGHFRNFAVVWAPGRGIVGRYEKVHRVPFGEYIPFRSLLDRVGDVSAVPSDAVAGSGPAVLPTPLGDLGCLVSYEVFFPERARSAARRDVPVMLVPTNAASFSTSQVPTQEVAAAQLRAIETGRAVLQAAPTGYTAVVDHRGRVRARTRLGATAVLKATVERRTGRTIYTALGPGPLVVGSFLALLVTLWMTRARAGLT